MKRLYVALLFVILLATSAFAKVNINTANVDELASLSGIGKVKAEAIVAYRTANGKFKTAEDLTKVKGIGDKTVEKIKGELTVEK